MQLSHWDSSARVRRVDSCCGKPENQFCRYSFSKQVIQIRHRPICSRHGERGLRPSPGWHKLPRMIGGPKPDGPITSLIQQN